MKSDSSIIQYGERGTKPISNCSTVILTTPFVRLPRGPAWPSYFETVLLYRYKNYGRDTLCLSIFLFWISFLSEYWYLENCKNYAI